MNQRLFRGDCLVLILGLVLAICVYWPGLRGGYFFDDYPNIVDNTDVHISTGDWRDWRVAALASPSAELRRPLAMLSFAGNYYFTGLDPFPMKLTNLAIHLVNGLLLWKVLDELLRMWRINRPAGFSDRRARLTASAVAGAWLLLPINLSAVLYVVQRMESMAQAFVLAGLWLYLAGRKHMQVGRGRSGLLACTSGIVVGSTLGLLCKESAVLLPAYTLLIEAALLRFDARTPGSRRGLHLLYGLTLYLPAMLGLAWLLPHTLSAAAYAGRPFNLDQRLLTETRILVEYLYWTLAPNPEALSFYHDDIQLSLGWLQPPTTLACALLLSTLIAAALALRKRLPLFSLGIGWFFAAHLLTATIIPLELVFEHRNYFASIGLLLALAALVLALPARLALLRLALPALAVAAFAAVTAMRAKEWSSPIQFAYSEALRHPLSARANYELGRTLTVASGYRPDSRLIERAFAAFEQTARLPHSGAAPLCALIVVSGHMHRPVPEIWWSQMSKVLAATPPTEESVSGLAAVARCQQAKICPDQTPKLVNAFLQALNHPAPSVRLLTTYGAFAANQLGDYAAAEVAFTDALAQQPRVAGIRMDLARVLLLENKFEQAETLLKPLDSQGLSHDEAANLAELHKAIAARQTHPAPASTAS